MNPRPALFFFVRVVALVCLVGCDRGPPTAATATTVSGVSIATVASLEAQQRTHVSVRGDRTTICLQADAQRALRVLGERGASALVGGAPVGAAPDEGVALSDRLAAALGTPGARLSIRAIAPFDGRRMVVYAAGSQRRTSLASLWVVNSTGEVATLVAGAAALAGASGLGDSLDLADAQCVATDRGVWLCVYHSDAAVFFLLPPGLGAGALLHPAFTRLKTVEGDLRLAAGDRLFARGDDGVDSRGSGSSADGGVGGGLGLLRADGQMLAIGDDGRVTDLPPVERGGRASAPPLTVALAGRAERYRLDFVVSDGPAADPFTAAAGQTPERFPKLILTAQTTASHASANAAPNTPLGTTPGMQPGMQPGMPQYAAQNLPSSSPASPLSPPRRIAFDRDAITVRPGFPVHALRLTAWCQDPASGDVIAYDAFSGEVMRMKLPAVGER